MFNTTGIVWCQGCGVEISWAPYTQIAAKGKVRNYYCCNVCVQGYPCHCGERLELDDERRSQSPGTMPS